VKTWFSGLVGDVGGTNARLALVDGDPTADIADTLSLRRVWRGGVEASLAPVAREA